MELIKISLIFAIYFVGTVLCDELCYDLYDGYFYCEYGCCGNTYDEYCCGVYSWIVAVSVIGVILVISAIVIIVFCFYKKKGRTGRVIQPNTNTQHVHTIQTVHVPPPGYNQPGYQQPPLMYNQQQYPPPPPQGDAAYPPPPPQY
ncbi:hypothetical protein ACF0H5_011240 [Mactra antiquata]